MLVATAPHVQPRRLNSTAIFKRFKTSQKQFWSSTPLVNPTPSNQHIHWITELFGFHCLKYQSILRTPRIGTSELHRIGMIGLYQCRDPLHELFPTLLLTEFDIAPLAHSAFCFHSFFFLELFLCCWNLKSSNYYTEHQLLTLEQRPDKNFELKNINNFAWISMRIGRTMVRGGSNPLRALLLLVGKDACAGVLHALLLVGGELPVEPQSSHRIGSQSPLLYNRQKPCKYLRSMYPLTQHLINSVPNGCTPAFTCLLHLVRRCSVRCRSF